VSDPRVIIIGAGFGGVAAAIELQKHGFRDLTLLDAAPELGGTWFHNTYPGAACDVPSHLYSFSFAQRRDWARLCPTQGDILTYLRDVAREHGVDRLLVADTRVTACRFSDADCRWSVETETGETYEAEAVVVATGQLHQPSFPRVEGAETFAGHTFHSARWDHDYPLAGKRVAVVGTGASAVQFVPEIAEQAAKLTVFQRTGNWFLPRKNHAYPRAVRAAIAHVPGLQAFRRAFIFYYGESLTLAIRHPRTVGRLVHLRSKLFMRAQLRDPEVRRKVWPDYTFGCKRVLFSSWFLPALQRENVELVTDAVAGMTPEGVVTADGTLHPVDCVIWGTGFRTTEFMFPMEVTGSEGRDLREAWGTARTRTSGSASRGSRRCSSCTGRTRTPRAARSSPTSRPRPATCARRCSRCARGAPGRSRCARRSRRPPTARCRPGSRGPRGRSATPGTATRAGAW
jgi:cation diffusion facilitator CzcD-associated flavoprotein CzcO